MIIPNHSFQIFKSAYCKHTIKNTSITSKWNSFSWVQSYMNIITCISKNRDITRKLTCSLTELNKVLYILHIKNKLAKYNAMDNEQISNLIFKKDLPALIWFRDARTRSIKAAGTVMVSRVSSNITSLRLIIYKAQIFNTIYEKINNNCSPRTKVLNFKFILKCQSIICLEINVKV